MLVFRCRVSDPNQLIQGNFARTFWPGVDFGAQGAIRRQLKTRILLVRGVHFEILSDLESTLGDMECKFFEDSVLNGSACRLNRVKIDFEYPSAAKC